MQQKLKNRYYPFLAHMFCTCLFVLLFLGTFNNKTNAAETESVRITLPIPSQSDYNIEQDGKKLKLSFSRPLVLQQDLTKDIPHLLKNQYLSKDKRNLSFDIVRPLTIFGQRKKQALIIEITPQKKKELLFAPAKVSFDIQKQDKNKPYLFTFKADKRLLYTIKTSPQKTTLYFLTPISLITHHQENYPLAKEIKQESNSAGGITIIIPGNLVSSQKQSDQVMLEINLPYGMSSKKAEYFLLKDQTQNASPSQTTSLSFPWNTTTGAAVFKRSDFLWIAFDHRRKIDLDTLSKQAALFVNQILNIPHSRGTILRLSLKENIQYSIRREGLLWILDLFKEGTRAPTHNLAIFTQYNTEKQPYFYIPTESSGNILSIVDPEIGDTINIVPLVTLNVGMIDSYDYPDMTLLKSIQGLALIPKTTDLIVNRGNNGITISANNRGLHLSADLDTIRRKQSLSQEIKSTKAFDFSISPQLLGKPFLAVVQQLEKDISSVDTPLKNQARLNLAKYYLSIGLGTEALSILEKLQNTDSYKNSEQIHSLLGIANFLLRRYDQATTHFSTPKLAEQDETIFWKTIVSAAHHTRPEDSAILLSFISLSKNYPPIIKAKIASIAASAALTAGDDIAAQNFIDTLKNSPYSDLYHQAEIDYLSAMKQALQGYPRNAIRTFKEISLTEDNKYATLANYERCRLSNKLGFMSNNQTISYLEGLYFAWKEKKFRLNLLQALAELYSKTGDYYRAMHKLNQSLRLEDEKGKERLIRQMVKYFEDIYLNNRNDNSSILKSLSLYRDFEWLAPQSKHYNQIIQRLADRLVAVDLLPRAQNLLEQQLQHNSMTPKERAQTGTRLALINLFEDKPHDALEVLNRTDFPELSQTLQNHRKIIKAKILAELGQVAKAIKLLENDYSKSALLMKSEFYWNNKQWDKASDAISYLVNSPKKDKPLSDEQISYILDWATALNMAGKTTVLVRLRNKFMPYFKNTKHYSTFSLLTSHLEDDKIDLKAINQVIADTQAFCNFTKIYNDTLKQKSLSETIK